MESKVIKSVVISIFIALIFSCGSTKKIASWHPPADQYAFVEYYTIYQGQALEGDPPPGMRIDGPTYMFDKGSGVLTSYQKASFNIDTASFILGAGIIRRGTEGGGISSRIIGAGKLPLKQGQVNFESISQESITFSFDDEKVSLGLGEVWEHIFESVDTIPAMNGNAVVLRRITHQVNFHGFYSKQRLDFHKDINL
ncbi:MAG: hypothetical protein RBR30_02285 [Tenuifilaceae bacterium]|nr:hypothetical protein [Tenuifilaceae bacterium]